MTAIELEPAHPPRSGRERQSLRRRQATAGTAISRVRAIASDPHIHEIAALVEEANRPVHQRGGRPRQYPAWCLVVFGACIRVYGSASATARALGEETMWGIVLDARASVGGAEASCPIPATGPTRDHWVYFVRSRLTSGVLNEMLELQRDLAVQRAVEIGLLERPEPPGRRRLQAGERRRPRRQGVLLPRPDSRSGAT